VLLVLDQVLIDVPCPACGFALEVQLLDARTQVWRWCPCCRARVRLIEPDGSVSVGLAAVDNAIRNFESSMKKLFR
jgi:hypothetical protein